MAVGVWDPKQAGPEINRELLDRFVHLGQALSSTQPKLDIDETEQQRYAALMHAKHALWQGAIKDLDNTQLWQLIRFLVIAEMQLPGWRADEYSPVIPIARELRERGTPLQKEQLTWLRKHSDNRFLPHGRIS